MCIKSCCKNPAKAFLLWYLIAEQTDKEFIDPLNSGSKVLEVGPPWLNIIPLVSTL